MNRAGRVIFILGLLIAVIAGFGVFLVLLINQPKPSETPTTRLVIAFQDIQPRTEVTADQVGIANWPRAIPTPTGGFANPVDVIGKLAVDPIIQGEPVLKKDLIDKSDLKETHSNAALVLEKGSVAIAVPVSSKTTVADAVQAGDRVDLLATFHSQSTTASGQIAIQRVLADLLVLQVGPWPSATQKSTNSGSSFLTFQLKEQDAMVLEYTMEHADSVTFVLRPASDHDLPNLEPVTFDYINQRFGFKLPR